LYQEGTSYFFNESQLGAYGPLAIASCCAFLPARHPVNPPDNSIVGTDAAIPFNNVLLFIKDLSIKISKNCGDATNNEQEVNGCIF
jgi:hypothetical protein